MSDGRKRIVSPFTWCKKQKPSNKTREKYMPVKRRQNLAETDRESCYKDGTVGRTFRQQRCILQW